MDIIDVVLARALTPQGQVETYAAKAQKAAQDALAAKADAADAVATVSAAATSIAETQTAAATLLSTAQEALETAQAAQIDIDAEIKQVTINTNVVSATAANTLQVITTYPDDTQNTQTITKLYKSAGNNEDGTMTQKAITIALNNKLESSSLTDYATKQYVTNAISNIHIPSGGSNTSSSSTVNINLGVDNAGKIVVVGEDGYPIAGVLTENDIIETLMRSGGYTAKNAVGLEVDYDAKTLTRTQEANTLSMGADFNIYPMYGGRKRCNVLDDGTITAFYGDPSYTEDGSNGQVMVYQPKFYYQRIPITTTYNTVGKIVHHDSFVISAVEQSGFKLHPLFITPEGETLEYVLLSAYEGSVYDVSENAYTSHTATNIDFDNDKLTSISGTKPVSGLSGLNLQRAEQLAQNRGEGWHIHTIVSESANQLLEIIEFGSMNGQASLGRGVCDLTVTGNHNQAAITGATSSLGNNSGQASFTTLENQGNITVGTEEGKLSISYRGVENPWGNVWQMLNGITIYGTVTTDGGIPHICTNYNYSYDNLNSDYISAGFSLPNSSNWLTSLGFGSKDFDWLLMPATTSNSANSALPIGDNGWFVGNLSGIKAVVHGGGWSFKDSDGLFYYGCDVAPNDTTQKSYGARLLYIPTKNAIYTANIAKWQEAN